MRGSLLIGCIVLLVYASAGAVDNPLDKDHMSDEIFMKAAWHMKIDAVEETPDAITVTTTGAAFAFASVQGTIICSQRIGKERKVLTAWLGGESLKGLKVTAKDTGAVILTSESGLVAKVNCDSLLMLRTAKPVGATFRHEFEEAVSYPAPDNRLWIDPFGAVGVYPIEKATALMQYAPDGNTHDVYALQAGGEIWVAIGPPRPYPWEQSLALRPIWQGSWESVEQNIPSDELIEDYPNVGTLLWMQSGGLLWKKREVAFEARLPERFQHALDTADKVGLPVIVWASPYYFTNGLSTSQSWEGENMGEYFRAIDNIFRNHPNLDGIYFDGVYPRSVKNTYLCCRAMREYLGDDRILMVHCTHNAPGGKWGRWAYNPAADTWATCILRGEGFGFVSSEWLRYFVSGYQISNTIGFVCNNAGHWAPTREQVEMTLRANARLAYMPMDTDEDIRLDPPPARKPDHIKAMKEWYWPHLDAGYREWFEAINETGAFGVPVDGPDSDPNAPQPSEM